MIPKLSPKTYNDVYSMFAVCADDYNGGQFSFSAKDNLTSVDFETKCGSRILEGYKPVFDAAAIEKMKKAGGKLIGKTNMDEFGFGSFSVNSAFGIPKNPYDLERSCGGSSGGSACAARVMDAHVSLGVSTGGSICCPASFCGVYGLVPTYGRVSRHGLLDYGNSFDKIGLLSANPADFKKYLPIISGKDDRDPTSCAQPPLELKGNKIKSVVVPDNVEEGLSADVKKSFAASLDKLKGMGIEISRADLSALKYAMPAYYIVATSEASTNLSRYCGMRYGHQDGDLSLKFDDYFTHFRTEYFGEETKRRILLGTYTRMAGFRDRYYAKALNVRMYVIDAYKKVLKDHDAVVTPTMPFVAPKLSDISMMTPVESYMADYLTVPPNLAGMPQISVPCGYDGNGLPMGLQFVADHWNEDLLVTMANEWSKGFATKPPAVRV